MGAVTAASAARTAQRVRSAGELKLDAAVDELRAHGEAWAAEKEALMKEFNISAPELKRVVAMQKAAADAHGADWAELAGQNPPGPDASEAERSEYAASQLESARADSALVRLLRRSMDYRGGTVSVDVKLLTEPEKLAYYLLLSVKAGEEPGATEGLKPSQFYFKQLMATMERCRPGAPDQRSFRWDAELVKASAMLSYVGTPAGNNFHRGQGCWYSDGGEQKQTFGNINFGCLPSESTTRRHLGMLRFTLKEPGITVHTQELIGMLRDHFLEQQPHEDVVEVVIAADAMVIKAGLVVKGGEVVGLVDGPVTAQQATTGALKDLGKTAFVQELEVVYLSTAGQGGQYARLPVCYMLQSKSGKAEQMGRELPRLLAMLETSAACQLGGKTCDRRAGPCDVCCPATTPAGAGEHAIVSSLCRLPKSARRLHVLLNSADAEASQKTMGDINDTEALKVLDSRCERCAALELECRPALVADAHHRNQCACCRLAGAWCCRNAWTISFFDADHCAKNVFNSLLNWWLMSDGQAVSHRQLRALYYSHDESVRCAIRAVLSDAEIRRRDKPNTELAVAPIAVSAAGTVPVLDALREHTAKHGEWVVTSLIGSQPGDAFGNGREAKLHGLQSLVVCGASVYGVDGSTKKLVCIPKFKNVAALEQCVGGFSEPVCVMAMPNPKGKPTLFVLDRQTGGEWWLVMVKPGQVRKGKRLKNAVLVSPRRGCWDAGRGKLLLCDGSNLLGLSPDTGALVQTHATGLDKPQSVAVCPLTGEVFIVGFTWLTSMDVSGSLWTMTGSPRLTAVAEAEAGEEEANKMLATAQDFACTTAEALLLANQRSQGAQDRLRVSTTAEAADAAGCARAVADAARATSVAANEAMETARTAAEEAGAETSRVSRQAEERHPRSMLADVMDAAGPMVEPTATRSEIYSLRAPSPLHPPRARSPPPQLPPPPPPPPVQQMPTTAMYVDLEQVCDVAVGKDRTVWLVDRGTGAVWQVGVATGLARRVVGTQRTLCCAACFAANNQGECDRYNEHGERQTKCGACEAKGDDAACERLMEGPAHTVRLDRPCSISMHENTPVVSDAGNHRVTVVSSVKAYEEFLRPLVALLPIMRKTTTLAASDVGILRAVMEYLQKFRSQRAEASGCTGKVEGPQGHIGEPTHEALVSDIQKLIYLFELGYKIVPEQLLTKVVENFFSAVRNKILMPDCGEVIGVVQKASAIITIKRLTPNSFSDSSAHRSKLSYQPQENTGRAQDAFLLGPAPKRTPSCTPVAADAVEDRTASKQADHRMCR